MVDERGRDYVGDANNKMKNNNKKVVKLENNDKRSQAKQIEVLFSLRMAKSNFDLPCRAASSSITGLGPAAALSKMLT